MLKYFEELFLSFAVCIFSREIRLNSTGNFNNNKDYSSAINIYVAIIPSGRWDLRVFL